SDLHRSSRSTASADCGWPRGSIASRPGDWSAWAWARSCAGWRPNTRRSPSMSPAVRVRCAGAASSSARTTSRSRVGSFPSPRSVPYAPGSIPSADPDMNGIGHGRASVLDGPRFDLVLGALVHALDVSLDLGLLDAPLSAAADLDRSEIGRAHV